MQPRIDPKKKGTVNRFEKGRYEAPPPSDKPEQGREVRPDLDAVESEKGAASPVTTEFGGAVSRHFNERRKIADVTDSQDTEYFDHDAFLAMEQQSLEKLANPETGAKMRPKDVAMAIGDLAGEMSGRNPDVPGNVTGDPKADAENASAYGDAKRVFMLAGEKAFPNVTVDSKNFGVDLERTSRLLREESDASFIPEMDPGRLQKMYDEDPKALAGKLDEILAKSGDLMRMRSRMNFDNKDPRRQEEENAHLAAGAEMLYKLQLMRDDLQEKMYGRKDVTSAEAKQIDAARDAVSGKTEREPAAEEGDEEARAALEALERSTGARAADAAAAIDALKGVWKKDGALAKRLASLAERVTAMTDLKLAADEKVAPEFARKVSVLQAYGDLMPAERRALAEAAREENERHAKEGRPEDGESAVSAERMFGTLIEALREKGR